MSVATTNPQSQPNPPKPSNVPEPGSLPKLPQTIFNLEKKGDPGPRGGEKRAASGP
jgi:hypothetical protein